ncbi:MAG TPA: osmotically inducible protein OsmC [Candidatus Aminicenantes bacterium]|nr:osmotically inducible protein OsmC [Candidatus Aminicenantes bacterium]
MLMEMRIHFPGGKQVTAEYSGFSIATDQPVGSGGDGSAPAPFDLFLASLATCAGIYVLQFLRQRDLPTEGLELVQRHEWNQETGHLDRVMLTIHLPQGFPEHYRKAIIQAAGLCAVKKHLESPPAFQIESA